MIKKISCSQKAKKWPLEIENYIFPFTIVSLSFLFEHPEKKIASILFPKNDHEQKDVAIIAHYLVSKIFSFCFQEWHVQHDLIHYWLLHSAHASLNWDEQREEHKKSEFFFELPFTKIHREVILWHKAFIGSHNWWNSIARSSCKEKLKCLCSAESRIKRLYTLMKVQVQTSSFTPFIPLSPGCLTVGNISDEKSLQKQHFLFENAKKKNGFTFFEETMNDVCAH